MNKRPGPPKLVTAGEPASRRGPEGNKKAENSAVTAVYRFQRPHQHKNERSRIQSRFSQPNQRDFSEERPQDVFAKSRQNRRSLAAKPLQKNNRPGPGHYEPRTLARQASVPIGKAEKHLEANSQTEGDPARRGHTKGGMFPRSIRQVSSTVFRDPKAMTPRPGSYDPQAPKRKTMTMSKSAKRVLKDKSELFDFLLFNDDPGPVLTFIEGGMESAHYVLMAACRLPHPNIFSAVLKKHDVNMSEVSGNIDNSVLHEAAWYGHFENVEMLLTLGNPIDAALENHCGESALAAAIDGGHKKCALALERYAKKYGTAPETKSEDAEKLRRSLEEVQTANRVLCHQQGKCKSEIQRLESQLEAEHKKIEEMNHVIATKKTEIEQLVKTDESKRKKLIHYKKWYNKIKYDNDDLKERHENLAIGYGELRNRYARLKGENVDLRKILPQCNEFSYGSRPIHSRERSIQSQPNPSPSPQSPYPTEPQTRHPPQETGSEALRVSADTHMPTLRSANSLSILTTERAGTDVQAKRAWSGDQHFDTSSSIERLNEDVVSGDNNAVYRENDAVYGENNVVPGDAPENSLAFERSDAVHNLLGSDNNPYAPLSDYQTNQTQNSYSPGRQGDSS